MKMKHSKIKTLFTKLTLLSMIVIGALFTGCNKEIEPIILEGSWDLDTSRVMVFIVYDTAVTNKYPTTIKFLEKNIETIRRELMKPQKITFKSPNISEFIYNEVPLPVEGTFVQENAIFTITNPIFPRSLSGASDNLYLELYYDYEYLMSIIYRLITEEDFPPEVYDQLIEKFEGVGVYKKGM